MRKKHQHYSEEEKLHLLHSYYQSGMSKTSFCKRHGISGITLLNKWLAKYESEVKEVSLAPCQDPTEMSDRSKEDYQDENARLKKRVKELEKALAFSRLETEARDLMITRAKSILTFPSEKNLGSNSNGTGQAAQDKSCARLPSVWPLPSSLLPVQGGH